MKKVDIRIEGKSSCQPAKLRDKVPRNHSNVCNSISNRHVAPAIQSVYRLFGI